MKGNYPSSPTPVQINYTGPFPAIKEISHGKYNVDIQLWT